jgi:hypothetical protein
MNAVDAPRRTDATGAATLKEANVTRENGTKTDPKPMDEAKTVAQLTMRNYGLMLKERKVMSKRETMTWFWRCKMGRS